MANLSNINGKFVVEQTTGYVGVGTTDPNYPIEVLNASAEIALNATGGSIYRVQSDSASNFIIRKAGVGDRLVIAGNGNATFTGNVLSSSLTVSSALEAGNSLINTKNLNTGGTGSEQFYVAHSGSNLILGNARGNLTFGTGLNAAAVSIDSSGNVGIGTTSPQASLHVDKDANGGVAEIILENSFTNTANSTDERTQIQGRFGGWDGSYIITGKEGDYTTAALRKSYLAFSTRTATTGMTEKMRIDSSGNVSVTDGLLSANISGSSDVFKLTRDAGANGELNIDFNGANANFNTTQGGYTFTTSSQTNALVIGSSGNSTFTGNIKVNLTSAVAGAISAFDSNGNTIWLTGRSSDGESSVSFRNNADSAYNGRIAATDTLMRFSQASDYTFDGNVGISTNVPASELQVGGTDLSATANFDAQFAVLSEATTGYPSGFIFKAPRVATSSNRILLNEDFGTYFSTQVYATSTGGAQSDIPIVFAPLGGNVGIGTDSPFSSAKLQVRTGTDRNVAIQTGTTHTTGIKINAFNDAANTNIPLELNGSLLSLKTGETERMRIVSTGNVLIGRTNLNISTETGFRFDENGEAYASIDTSGTNAWHVYDMVNNAYRFFVSSAGQIYATSTSISAISDVTLKENIKPLETGLNEVMKLQPRRFDWKNGDGKNIAGFVAQEVEEILPDLVSDYKYNDEETKKAIKMGDMIPTLVKAIQELKAEVELLKSK